MTGTNGNGGGIDTGAGGNGGGREVGGQGGEAGNVDTNFGELTRSVDAGNGGGAEDGGGGGVGSFDEDATGGAYKWII